MKNKAIFTIVRNEKIFLPIWLKYYKQFFENQDIYVLNDDSNDGSTENLDVNVINLETGTIVLDVWRLKSVVCNFQKQLLEKYKVVFFAESDEFIYHENGLECIYEKILNGSLDYFSVNGFDYVHKLEEEFDLNLNDPISKQRKYWVSKAGMKKSLITKIPLDYTLGFHEHFINGKREIKNFQDGLYMFHIKHIDKKLYIKRQLDRLNFEKIYPLNGLGDQNKHTDPNWYENNLKNMQNSLTKIPFEIKYL